MRSFSEIRILSQTNKRNEKIKVSNLTTVLLNSSEEKTFSFWSCHIFMRNSWSHVVRWLFSFFYSFRIISSFCFYNLYTYLIKARTCFVSKVLMSITVVFLIPMFLNNSICSSGRSLLIFFASLVSSLNS